jgi:hypothetical protein
MKTKPVRPRILPLTTEAKDSRIAINWLVSSKPIPVNPVMMIERSQYPVMMLRNAQNDRVSVS